MTNRDTAVAAFFLALMIVISVVLTGVYTSAGASVEEDGICTVIYPEDSSSGEIIYDCPSTTTTTPPPTTTEPPVTTTTEPPVTTTTAPPQDPPTLAITGPNDDLFVTGALLVGLGFVFLYIAGRDD